MSCFKTVQQETNFVLSARKKINVAYLTLAIFLFSLSNQKFIPGIELTNKKTTTLFLLTKYFQILGNTGFLVV